MISTSLFLGIAELNLVVGKCSDRLHVQNPAKPEIDRYKFIEWLKGARLKAFHLLKVHQVDLSGNTGMYVVELMGADKNGPIWRRLDRTGPV